MSTTAVRVEDIRPISHAEGMRLAETEYQRFADAIGKLGPDDWGRQTVNDAWNVRQLVAHVLGFADGNASIRETVHAMRLGRKRAQEKGYDHFIHGVNEVQVEEREHLTPDELVSRWAAMWPKALKGRHRFPPFLRRVPMDFGPL